jgi:DNA mismatch endonuclease (patch repair protein)
MTDNLNAEQRSRNMARIRSNANFTTELRFLRILRRYKISGWRRRSKLPGRPDFVFTRRKVAVFIDGDFWHGNPKRFRLPKSNVGYWEQKILGNRMRDREINKELKRLGWRVLRFWESSLRDEEAIMGKLTLLL